MIIRGAQVFTPENHFAVQDICITGERFTAQGQGQALDAAGLFAIPGLIDLHLHGCAGVDFSDADIEALQRFTEYQASQGITAICPAAMSYPAQKLLQIAQMAAAFTCVQGASMVGIRLEGPFLNPEKKGAQKQEYLCAPDIDMITRLQAAAKGKIKILDLAAELTGALPLIDAMHKDMIISLAHTTADYDTAYRALAHGARQITHLYNAMSPFDHREPGVIGAAFDTPECFVELICDGVHLAPTTVRAAFRMFGENRIILISDSMQATGLGDGGYSFGGQAVTVEGRRATLADGTLAGSVTNLMDCLRIAVTQMQIPLTSAVRAATVNPACALGISQEYGSIKAGQYANCILLDENLQLVHLFCRGRQIY